MKRCVIFTFYTILMVILFPDIAKSEDKVLKMSTTTSTQASGLLDVLMPELEKDTGIKVKVIAKGTGAAIRDGQDGNVDIILVHAKAREEQFVREGYGTKRYALMHNDFVILGPAADPAGIKGCTAAATALQTIAEKKAGFVSRGDDSGTHTKEQALWKETGLKMETKAQSIIRKGKKKNLLFIRPAGSEKWYFSIGQGMGKTLVFAEEKQMYTIADRGTYIKYKFGRDIPIDLVVLCDGDAALTNPYGIIPVNPGKHSHVKYDLAKQVVEWLVSKRGQDLIAAYRLIEEPLFYPDAM
jgi:tungstate transport system substrate-binding protein